MPRHSIVVPPNELAVLQVNKLLNWYWTCNSSSRSWVVAGDTDILLATSHQTAVCLSSATSSSYQNIQLTSSYISFYKDQWANPNNIGTQNWRVLGSFPVCTSAQFKWSNNIGTNNIGTNNIGLMTMQWMTMLFHFTTISRHWDMQSMGEPAPAALD